MKIHWNIILIIAMLSAHCYDAEASSKKNSFEQTVFDSAYSKTNKTFKKIWGFDIGSPESPLSKPLQIHKKEVRREEDLKHQKNLELNGYIFQIPGSRVGLELNNHVIAIRSEKIQCAVFGDGYENMIRESLKIPKELKMIHEGFEAEIRKIEAELENLSSLSALELHRSIYASSSDDLDADNPLAKHISALYLLGFKPNLADSGKIFHYEDEDTILIITHPPNSSSYSGSFMGTLFPKNLDSSFTFGGKISSSEAEGTFFDSLVWRLLNTNIKEEGANKSE